MNELIAGFSRKKVCIISAKTELLKEYILGEIKRGVSIYAVTGGYLNQEMQELVTVLDKNEYVKLMKKISEVDDKAFVTVYTVSEVVGIWNNA